jgi:phosphoglycerate kinase
MKIKSIRQLKSKNIRGKKVLLRSDFNVPIKNGKISDKSKIVKSLASIKYLRRYNAKIILMSHLGRPEKNEKSLSLKPVAKVLSELLDQKVTLVKEYRTCEGATVIAKMKERDIVLLENIRYNKEEEKNDDKFAKELASLGDIYVNNAFAVSHRKHASLVAIKKYLPAYCGILLQKEIENLYKILKPQSPFLAVVGGAKMATKVALINNLAKKTKDTKILLGGAVANVFLLARGYEVGKSLVNKEYLKVAKKFSPKNIIMPLDAVVKNFKSKKISVKNIRDIGKGDIILDIGPETIKLYSNIIRKAKTIIWNGPLGYFEDKRFKNGTMAIAILIAARSTHKAFTVIGGGETVEAVEATEMKDHINWISTGGGAMLSFLSNKKMPGLKGIVKI